MYEPINERLSIWDQFLERWPLGDLSEITLEEYTTAGSQDCFTYWLEAKTESLGSIWGGSAFKSGIFARASDKDSVDEDGRSYSEKYGWYSKYGDTPEKAFKSVIAEVVKVATAARDGRLEDVDAADLGDAFKWKLAFLYQNRDTPCVLPIYKKEFLRTVLDSNEKRVSVLQEQLMEGIGSLGILEYGDNVWNSIQKMITTELTPDETKAYLDASPSFSQIRPPTKKLAGYETQEGKQVALELTNKNTTIYLSSGQWLNQVENALKKVMHYGKDKSRHSNFSTNAPKLDIGNEIVRIIVPTKEILIEVCDVYANDEISNNKKNFPVTGVRRMPSLNQILYGPPGTGKTFETINAALEILDPVFFNSNLTDRAALKARFDELSKDGQVKFVTFHQSFSYEDFVEGLRAVNDEENHQINYEVVDGVFKSMCNAAAAKVTKQVDSSVEIKSQKIWKMSLGNSLGSDSYIYDECIENGYVLLGYGGLIDFKECNSREDIVERFLKEGKERGNDEYPVTAVNTFLLKMKVGDLIVVTEGNNKFRAIGQITGDYKVISREEQGDHYGQCREVSWLRVYTPSLPSDQLMNNKFSQMTLYKLSQKSINLEKLTALLKSGSSVVESVSKRHYFSPGELIKNKYEVLASTDELVELKKPNGNRLPITMRMLETLAGYISDNKIAIADIENRLVFDKVADSDLEPFLVNGYNNIIPALVERLLTRGTPNNAQKKLAAPLNAKVLVIDEINRGNISRIFGELITLIEPSKRAEAAEALEVTLPYSKDKFTVPSNLYLVGTMNTADRSLAGLDIALRRRFNFRELPPRPDLLDGIIIEGIDVSKILCVMNERIEVLLDRDHCLGHAYFIGLSDISVINELAYIFSQQIFPLLQEYFFEDWERIAWVLNDQNKSPDQAFISRKSENLNELFGSDTASNLESIDRRWAINEKAFTSIDSYIGIYGDNE